MTLSYITHPRAIKCDPFLCDPKRTKRLDILGKGIQIWQCLSLKRAAQRSPSNDLCPLALILAQPQESSVHLISSIQTQNHYYPDHDPKSIKRYPSRIGNDAQVKRLLEFRRGLTCQNNTDSQETIPRRMT